MSTFIDRAAPHMADAAPNSARPAISVYFRPQRSAIAPDASTSAANVSVYALTTHSTCEKSACSARAMAGSETATMFASRLTMNDGAETQSSRRSARVRVGAGSRMQNKLSAYATFSGGARPARALALRGRTRCVHVVLRLNHEA